MKTEFFSLALGEMLCKMYNDPRYSVGRRFWSKKCAFMTIVSDLLAAESKTAIRSRFDRYLNSYE